MAAKKQASSSTTITDVARKAGVSRTAVSYVLNDNGQRNRHVSDDTRSKVLQAVQELNFRPDATARALSRGHSEEIVATIGSDLNPFIMQIISSLQKQTSVYGYTSVLYNSQGFSEEKRKELYETIFARHPLGIITTSLNFTQEDVDLARKMGVKYFVFVGMYQVPIEGTYSIVFPIQQLGYHAARHLIARGHRRLAIVQPADEVQKEAFQQRVKGMQAAMAEVEGVTLDILSLELSPASALSVVEAYLLGSDRPSGIYGFSDEYALVLLGALARSGVKVPQEVAVVGTDDLPVCEYIWPSISSIRFDALDIGKRAVEMIHNLDEGLPFPEELTHPLIPQLIERESS